MNPIEQVLAEAAQCQLCHADNLLFAEGAQRAFPVLHRDPPWPVQVMIVAEATNRSDTFRFGRISVDVIDNDPTGRFQRELLASVGLRPEDLLVTNAVLCLPRQVKDKYPVNAVVRQRCAGWLRRLIDAANPQVVLTFGATALEALKAVEKHRLVLRESTGKLHPWYGRHVLPLYHCGHYGQMARPREQQLQEIAVLRDHLTGGTA